MRKAGLVESLDFRVVVLEGGSVEAIGHVLEGRGERM